MLYWLCFIFLFLNACTHHQVRRQPSSLNPPAPVITAQQTKTFSGPFDLNPDGSKRSPAKIYLPLQFAQQDAWPLVVLLHGLGGTAETQEEYLNLRQRVSAMGFILMIPQGTPSPDGTLSPDGQNLTGLRFWNATDFCCDFGKTKVDDVSYLSRLIELAKTKYNVDTSRVYIWGHSNGGFMANRLACEIGDISGIVSLAGGSFSDIEKCKNPHPVSFTQIHAIDDPVVSFETTPQYAGAKSSVQQWLTRNNCSEEGKKGEYLDFIFTIPGPDTSIETWTNCSSGKSVSLWTIRAFDGAGHNPHVPKFGVNFTDAVLAHLLKGD